MTIVVVGLLLWIALCIGCDMFCRAVGGTIDDEVGNMDLFSENINS